MKVTVKQPKCPFWDQSKFGMKSQSSTPVYVSETYSTYTDIHVSYNNSSITVNLPVYNVMFYYKSKHSPLDDKHCKPT